MSGQGGGKITVSGGLRTFVGVAGLCRTRVKGVHFDSGEREKRNRLETWALELELSSNPGSTQWV